MKPYFAVFFCLFFSFVSLAQTPKPADEVAPATSLRFSTVEELGAEFSSVPCKNGDRLDAVKALFEKMGAKPEEVTVEKISGGSNVLIWLAGSSSEPAAEKIIIGAHLDKTANGCGAIDNWTGIVTLAHIYRTVKGLKSNKSILFIAFGEEEKGMVGSEAMAGKIKKEQIAEYCAMINIDSLGLANPQVADNLSTKKLMDFTANLAKQMKIQFAHARIEGAGADSMPFMNKKIPAVTIHALTNEWPNILHTNNDKAEKVNPTSVYLGYRLAFALLVKVDEAPCNAFREGKEGKEKK